MKGTKAIFTGGGARVPLLLRAPPPCPAARSPDGGAAHLARAALGSQLRRVRLALVTAPCARMAIVALTAMCVLPAAAAAADLQPCGNGALRLGHGAARGRRPRRRDGPGRIRALRASHGARSRATPSSSAPGATACRPRPAAPRCWRCSSRCATRRDIVLVDARGTGRSGRVGERTDAYGAGAAAGRSRCGARPSSASATSSSTPPATARASRSPTPRATATGCARWCSTAARARRSSPATAAPRRTGSARRSARARPRRRAAGGAAAHAPAARARPDRRRRARARDRARGRALARRAARRRDRRARGRRRAARAPRRPHRGAAAAPGGAGAGEQLPRRRAAARRAPRWTAGRSPARPGCARSASPPARAGRSRRRRIRSLPAGAALSGAPALVLAGELGVGAPTATLRKIAGLLPSGTYVRVRGAAALPALNDPSGCAGDARARVPGDARQGQPGLREPPRAPAAA